MVQDVRIDHQRDFNKFYNAIQRYAVGAVREEMIRRINANAPPITAARGKAPDNRGRTEIIASSEMLPIHVLRRQTELQPLARKKVTLSDGRVVPRGFHNPIRAGRTDFIVAWQRRGKERLPVDFVLDNPAPAIQAVMYGIAGEIGGNRIAQTGRLVRRLRESVEVTGLPRRLIRQRRDARGRFARGFETTSGQTVRTRRRRRGRR